MIIDTVEISNLGLWENLFLKFDKSINIIQGENGVGKTTLLALLYSLFHDSGIIKFTNKNQEAYICMNLHDSKEKLVLKKVYKKGQSGYFVSSFADIKKIARMEENKVFIFIGEFFTGSLLRKMDACPWDYSDAPLNIRGLIRLDYAPLWFGAGLLFEKILRIH